MCPFEGCQKEFITKGHLKTHELIHSGDRPFSCERCDKSYSRSGRLKIHMRTHVILKHFMLFRLERSLSSAPLITVIKLLLRKVILRPTLEYTREKSLICAVLKIVTRTLRHKDT